MLKRLKDLREENDMTQSDLSKIFGIARSNISKYESGELEPNIEILNKYADYFRCSVDYLLGRTNSRSEILKRPSNDEALLVVSEDSNIDLVKVKEYIEFLSAKNDKKD